MARKKELDPSWCIRVNKLRCGLTFFFSNDSLGILSPVLLKILPHVEIWIVNQTHFVDVVGVYGGVEARVEIVEQIHDLKRGRVGRDRGESDDVREVNRHLGELLGIYWHTELKLFRNRAESNSFFFFYKN